MGYPSTKRQSRVCAGSSPARVTKAGRLCECVIRIKKPQTIIMANTEKTNESVLLGNPKDGMKPIILHYVNVFKPKENLSGKLKYSARIVIPKEDKASVAAIRGIEKKLLEVANRLAGNKLSKKFSGSILKDGDGDDNEKDDESLHGCYFFNASKDGDDGKKGPGCMKRSQGALVPATEDDIYSGGKAVVDLNFFIFGVPDATKTGGNMGISASLQNILAAPGGTRIGGGRSAESAFGDVEVGEENETETWD